MSSPNILFLMTDQMQGRVLEPDNPCQTPNLDRLAARECVSAAPTRPTRSARRRAPA